MAGILDEFLILFKPTVQGTGFQVLNKQIKHTYDSLFSVKGLLRTFVGYDLYSGIKAFTGSMINATREMGAMRSRFFAITGDEAKANQQLQWAFDLARRTAMPMKSLADSYSIFYSATQKGLGDAGAQQVFQDWTEVSRVLHLSEYQFERVTYALREMASKGVVYSQDLRMQIGTHVPNAIGLAEKAVNDLGITGTDWFEKFQKQSKGNQKMINQFLVLFSKYAKQQFADPKALEKALMQPDAQIARLANQWDRLRYAMADAGFSDDLNKALFHLNNTLDKIVDRADEFYKIIKSVVGLLLVIGGVKIFGKIFKSLRGFTRMFRRFGTKGKLGFFGNIGRRFGVFWKSWKGFGASIKNTITVAGALAKKFGIWRVVLSAIRIITVQLIKFGLKGLINLIPIVGQIIFLIWTVIDVIKILWQLFSAFFPDIARWIRELGSEIVDFILHPIISIKQWWDKWFGGKKGGVNFPQPTPDKNSWEYMQKDMVLNNPLRLAGGGTPINLYPQQNVTNTNYIDANNMSPYELGDVLDRINKKNNTDLMNIYKGIGDSKNKN